ncbi:hypothetical protein SeMB42_g06113, partial [Synchytrium endobioticum]
MFNENSPTRSDPRPKSAKKTPGSARGQMLLTSFFGKPASTPTPRAGNDNLPQPPPISQSLSPISSPTSTAPRIATANASLSFNAKNESAQTSNFSVKPVFDDDLDRMFDDQDDIILSMELDETPISKPSFDMEIDTKDVDGASRNSLRKISLKRLRTDGDEEEDDAGEESDIPSRKIKTPTTRGNKAKRKRVAVNDEDSDVYKPESADDPAEASLDECQSENKEPKSARSHRSSLKTPARRNLNNFSFKTPGTATSVSSRAPSSAVRTPTNKVSTSRPTSTGRKSFVDEEERRSERVQKFNEKNEKRYAFLKDIRDAEGRKPDDPEYDPRTLYIPPSAFNGFTEFEKQFWRVKKDYWDTIVFFKKGKFYELYEKDADIANQVFDLKMTDRVNMRMAGVPESSFDGWAAQFLAKGYKVARVDQLESSVGKTLREREGTEKAEKVIRRELTSVLTLGTLVDPGLLTNDMSTYCLALKEEVASEYALPTFGICFVDTATAEFRICTFNDDVDRTRLETLLLQLQPRELVLEKSSLSSKTARVVKNSCSTSVIINYLRPETEFWDADITADELRGGGYFVKNGSDGKSDSWPRVIQDIMESPTAMSALGGLIWYLRSCKLDKDLVSAGNFHMYDPVQEVASLVLDGQTLLNLEVFQNTIDGSESGTLFSLLNHCATACGKRLFKRTRWMDRRVVFCSVFSIIVLLLLVNVPSNAGCATLQGPSPSWKSVLMLENEDLLETLTAVFARLPDLERTLSRIHTGGCKVTDFVKALEALEALLLKMKELARFASNFKSKRLAALITNGFPCGLKEKLKWFHDAFDHEQALNENKITPSEGYDEVYDDAQTNLERIEILFEEHKKECESELKCGNLCYKDLGKEIYQLVVPARVKVPRDWVQMSKTQNVIRYYTPRIKRLAQEMAEAKETRGMAVRDVKARMYAKFDENYTDWLRSVKSVAEIDSLMSLAKCRSALGEPCCRPRFLSEGPSVLQVRGLRHPCVVPGLGSGFIPNDTVLGGANEPTMILLTGPNMGGKSTLLRQLCIAVIMAQLGCHLPAESCVLTPFDRVFTRIGANDNILAGQSTFMVELAETSRILREATPRSLVILDELGRGTSTFDGFAIAYSCLHHLVQRTRCLGLFSTHYQTLTSEFADNPLVGLRYMSSVVDEESKEVIFLYKLEKGVCPKSYGMHVAHIAGVPRSIVDRADEVAARFEHNHQIRQVKSISFQTLPMARLADFVELLKTSNMMLENRGHGTTSALSQQMAIVKTIWQSLQKQK